MTELKPMFRAIWASVKDEMRSGPGRINAYIGIVLLAMIGLMVGAAVVKSALSGFAIEHKDWTFSFQFGGWDQVGIIAIFLLLSIIYWLACLCVFDASRRR